MLRYFVDAKEQNNATRMAFHVLQYEIMVNTLNLSPALSVGDACISRVVNYVCAGAW